MEISGGEKDRDLLRYCGLLQGLGEGKMDWGPTIPEKVRKKKGEIGREIS